MDKKIEKYWEPIKQRIELFSRKYLGLSADLGDLQIETDRLPLVIARNGGMKIYSIHDLRYGKLKIDSGLLI